MAAWLLRHPLQPFVRWPHREHIPFPAEQGVPITGELRTAIDRCGGEGPFTERQRDLQNWVVPILISTFGTGRDGRGATVSGFEPVLKRLVAKEPCLIVVPHLGPFLSITSHLLASGASVTETTLFDPEEMESLRHRFAPWGPFGSSSDHHAVWVGNPVAPMTLLKALRRGETVCWQPDVPVPATSANTVPGRFLGVEKHMSTLPHFLWERSGAQVYVASARLDFDAPMAPHLTLRYEAFEPAEPDPGSFVGDLHAQCESLVLAEVDQWVAQVRGREGRRPATSTGPSAKPSSSSPRSCGSMPTTSTTRWVARRVPVRGRSPP